MKLYARNYFDLSPTDIADLSERLSLHPVVRAQAVQNKITVGKAISEAFEMWRKGEIKPVFDPVGIIIGFQ